MLIQKKDFDRVVAAIHEVAVLHGRLARAASGLHSGHLWDVHDRLWDVYERLDTVLDDARGAIRHAIEESV